MLVHETSKSTLPVEHPRDQWSTQQVVMGTLTLIGVGFGFWLLYRFAFVLFSFLVALMLHIGIKPVVDMLYRFGVPKRAGVILVYILLLLLIIGLLLLLIPLLTQQIGMLTNKLPEYYTLVRDFLQQSPIKLLSLLGNYLPPQLNLSFLPVVTATPISPAATTSPLLTISTLSQNIFITIAVFMMAFYWTLDRDRILYAFLLRTPAQKRDNLRQLINEMEEKVGAFYRGTFILCTIIGGLQLVIYWLLGLPYAIILATFAFIFEAVPIIGPAVGALPAVFIALAIAPDKAPWVIVASVLIQLAENYLLTPRVMGNMVGVNPIVTILAIAAFTSLFGLLGGLLAIPLAAIIQILLERFLFSATSEILEAPVDLRTIEATTQARGHLSVLRLDAQGLAQDIKKQLRTQDNVADEQVEHVQELLETCTTTLQNILSEWNDSAMKRAQLNVVAMASTPSAKLVEGPAQ